MDFDKLQTFYHVAKSGSFTKAGDIVNLSQSAVSRQVIYLEDRLKTKLFKRKARGLSLTTQGEVLYERVGRILDEVDSLRTAISETDIYDKGSLSVATTTALATMWLVPYLNEFCETHPKIDVTIIGDDNNLDLFFHNADAVVRTYIPHARQLIQEYLMTWNVCLFASKSYLEKHGAPKNPEDLGYVSPIVDLKTSRQKAIDVFGSLKKES